MLFMMAFLWGCKALWACAFWFIVFDCQSLSPRGEHTDKGRDAAQEPKQGDLRIPWVE